MQILNGQAISKKPQEKNVCVCVCVRVGKSALASASEQYPVITLLEKKKTHFFQAHLFLSTLHTSLQHVDIADSCFEPDWHYSVLQIRNILYIFWNSSVITALEDRKHSKSVPLFSARARMMKKKYSESNWRAFSCSSWKRNKETVFSKWAITA